jgi:pyrroline-5-carboxylate reductase
VGLGKRISVIGAGKIGQTLISGMIDGGLCAPRDVMAVTRHADTLAQVKRKHRVRGTLQLGQALRQGEILLICVKPQAIQDLLQEMRGQVNPSHLIVTTVASVPTAYVEKSLGCAVPVIRTMPNTPCLIRSGMTGICAGRHVRPEHLKIAERIFNTLGLCVIVDEKHMDAVTGLSGSGPAYMYTMIEALAEGGVKVGLPRETATLLAAQTMLGAGRMILETREHPALLKDAVTTPAGCTIDGILEMEEGGLRVTLIKTVVKATRRAADLFQEPPAEPR